MILAKVAREVAENRYEVYADFLNHKIMMAAMKGHKYVRILDYPYCKWLKTKKVDSDAARIIVELQEKGYRLMLEEHWFGALSQSILLITW